MEKTTSACQRLILLMIARQMTPSANIFWRNPHLPMGAGFSLVAHGSI